jgi:D-sedoheptulose 7-phosphate isomerase
MQQWSKHIDHLRYCLTKLSVRNRSGQDIDPAEGFAYWKTRTLEMQAVRKTFYLIGNGASASMASHLAADLAKNAHLHTEVFSDFALITAISNDIGYEEVFAEPLRRRMIEGDLLLAISSSGESLNILRAVQAARELGGVVVTLSAMEPENKLRTRGDINFYLPAQTYGMAESCHAAILHYWMDLVSADVAQIPSLNRTRVLNVGGQIQNRQP